MSRCLRSLSLVILLTSLLSCYVCYSASTLPEAVILQDVEAQDAHDWEKFLSLRTTVVEAPENRDILALFIEHNFKCFPLANVVSAELIGVKEIPYELASIWTAMDEYAKFYEDVAAYYVAISYTVKQETKYIYNGVNYRLYILGVEAGRWVIVEVSVPPIHLITEAGVGFGTPEEKVAMWIQLLATRTGVFLNPKGERIQVEECSEE